MSSKVGRRIALSSCLITELDTSTDCAAFEVRSLRKSFGATKALDGASFTVKAGSAHALLGENGAGKSTLIKVLSGTLQPDGGEILISGRRAVFRGPRDAHRAGLQTAFQELTLVPDLTILQNMLLPYQPQGFAGQLKKEVGRRLVAAHLDSLGLGDVDLRKEVRDLSLNIRQKIEIARAIYRKPRVLLLDEATSALAGSDMHWFASLLERLKSQGVTVVFITHRMAEVREFCDQVTVLRNGRDVGSFGVTERNDHEIVELIMGRSLSAAFPPKPVASSGVALLSANDISVGNRLTDCKFELRAGEIVGLAALQGMGQQELFLSLFGAVPFSSGHIDVYGERVRLASPQQAISLGIGLVPEERKTEGLFLKLTGKENVLAPALQHFVRHGLLRNRRETSAAAAVMKRVQIDRRALYTAAGAFSGGNQQKLVLGKWLIARSRILLLFDPCRGVDIGTKHEIYLLIRAHVAAGGTVLVYSTEIPELVNLCDRILVMYKGRLTCELRDTVEPIREHDVMRAVLGDERPREAVGVRT